MEFNQITLLMNGYTSEQMNCVASVLEETSCCIKGIAVKLNSEEDLKVVDQLIEVHGKSLDIGVSGVKNMKEVQLALDSDIDFMISAGMMTPEMLVVLRVNHVTAISGAMTPSEIENSIVNGANVIGVFPAGAMNLNYASMLKSAMGDMKLMAIGGINKKNVHYALSGGYDYVLIEDSIFNQEDIKSCNVNNLKKSLKEFEELL